MMLSVVLLPLLASQALASCNYGTTFFPREPNVPASTFSYAGLTGPLNWYGLNTTANALCDMGKNQSPIAFNSSSFQNASVGLSIPDYPGGAVLENLGTNVEVVVNGSLETGGKNYSLAQFHFHSPSEHRINGEYFPIEAHFVFQAQDKSMAVLAFVIELGTADPLLTAVFTYVSDIPTAGNATLTGPLFFSGLENHLNANPVFQYNGSLTTPPCSEGVQWTISAEPLYIDVGTYQRVKKVVKYNARYTQDSIGTVNLLQNTANELNKTSG